MKINISEDPDDARVRKALDDLSEHFDSVQIFVTRHEEKQFTVNIVESAGNAFASLGQIRMWLLKEEEMERELLRDALAGAGDDWDEDDDEMGNK